MRVHSASALLCIAGGIAFALSIVLEVDITDAAGSSALASERTDARREPIGGGLALDPAEPRPAPEASSARVVVPPQASESSSPPIRAGSRPPSGLLRIGAIDAESDARIASFRVRAGSVDRLADYATQYASSTIDLRLSPGTYSLLVMSAGYEAAEIDGVRIVDRGSIRFEDVRLFAGTGKLLGTVRGARNDGDLTVELLGEGRHPCPKCPSSDLDTCTTCGYSIRASRLPVGRDGRFAFERLASGTYSIFLSDDQDRILGPPTVLDLRSSETLSVALELPRLRELRLEILDTDGSSLSEAWAGRGRVERNEQEKIEFVDLPAFEGSIRDGELEWVAVEWIPPAPDGRPGVASFKHGTCCWFPRHTGGYEIDDLPRDPLEPLRPTVPPPTLRAPELFLDVRTDGTVVVERMPASRLMLAVSCGPFHGTAEIPASSGSTRVRIALSLDGSVPATPEERTYQGYEARRYGLR